MRVGNSTFRYFRSAVQCISMAVFLSLFFFSVDFVCVWFLFNFHLFLLFDFPGVFFSLWRGYITVWLDGLVSANIKRNSVDPNIDFWHSHHRQCRWELLALSCFLCIRMPCNRSVVMCVRFFLCYAFWISTVWPGNIHTRMCCTLYKRHIAIQEHADALNH